MVATESIQVERVKQSRISQVDFADLPFGKIYTDHMFMADYRDGEWKNLRVVPYGHISISPATPALHYGQSIFEGVKAYKNIHGEVAIFRPKDNNKRFNISAERLAMPHVPEEIFICLSLLFLRAFILEIKSFFILCDLVLDELNKTAILTEFDKFLL